ncbi:MAG: hypothetical protein R3320_11720, partial [Nitriliruptorales bacterium]|nr:hypothetical protein [Nitriliruptorales bacterium]
MRHLRKRTGPLAMVMALSLALAACGGEEENTPPTDTATQAQTQTEATTEAEASPDSTTADQGTSEASLPADPFKDLKVAAQAVGNNGSAKALATGIAAATGMDGDVESAAAQTYATLATLLQEHVYLAGIAVDAGVNFGLDSEAFEAAAAALDENSVELADVVGSVAPDERDAFLELWRQHIGHFVTYTEGKATDDQEKVDQALSNLDEYRSQAGAFFEKISGGEIPASAVEESLKGHINTLTAAIDAAVAGETSVFSELREAASHVGESGSAKALASGIAAAAGMDGDVESQAAQTYASLSTILEEHVYLSGIAVKTAFAQGLDSEAFKAAEATLDENTVELADLVGSVAPDQRDAFIELWRQHIG